MTNKPVDASGMTFNQTVSGGNVQQQLGAGNTQHATQHIGGSDSDWRPPFDEVAKQVENKSWPNGTDHAIVSRYETPAVAVSAAVEEIEADLDRIDSPAVEAPEAFTHRKKTWSETFRAMAPMGIKLACKVGSALTKHFAETSAAGVAAAAFFDTLTDNES